jgi:hypothetical protein
MNPLTDDEINKLVNEMASDAGVDDYGTIPGWFRELGERLVMAGWKK